MTSEELNGMPEPLDPGEEFTLLADKGVEARNKLLIHTLKAAARYAAALTRGQLALDELVSLSAVALLKAIEKYDARRHKKTGRTTPTRLIIYSKSFIKHEVSESWRLREPVNYGRRDIPEEPVEAIELDTVAAEGGGPDFERIDLNERLDLIKPHFNKLTELERRVLTLIFESRIPGPEIGRMLGFTRANVHEIKLRGLRKIRNGLMKERRLFNS